MSEFFATNAPDPPRCIINLCFHGIRTIWVHLGPFGCHTNRGTKQAELVQKFENEVASEFFAPNAPIHPIGPKTDVLVHFVLFGCIWDRLVALQHSVQNEPNLCKSLCHEVASEFFATNAPDPTHWTINLCFGAIRTIWVHL